MNSIDRLVGQRVRFLRLHRGMSQSALAEHLGLTFQQVQKYEKGTNRISASKLVEIARALGVHVADLFPDEIDTKPAAGSSTLDIAIAKKVLNIRDDAAKRRLLKMITTLK